VDFCFGTEREKRGCVGIASRHSPLRRGAPVEASPQQRRRQQCCGEQWHSNGSGKGIPATTAWHSLIAASSAFFLLSLYILLHRKRNRRSSHVNDTIISSNLFLSLSLCSCEDFKRNGDRANFYNSEVVICVLDIEFGVDGGTGQLIQGFSNQWQWCPVLDRDFILLSVIHVQA